MSNRETTLHARVSTAILEAAAALPAERGEQASMADVAAAAGMARATVYRYFPNREALFEAPWSRSATTSSWSPASARAQTRRSSSGESPRRCAG
jgi:hypothetical protein